MTQIPDFQSGNVQPAGNLIGRQTQQLGQAAFQVGVDQLRMAELQQQRIDRAKTRQADAQAWSTASARIAEFEQLQGLNAVDAYVGLEEAYDDETRAVAQSLNDRQREAFEGKRLERRERYIARARSHYNRQLAAADRDENLKSLNSEIEDGIGASPTWAAQDPEGKGDAAREVVSRIKLEAQQLAQKEGVGEDSREAYVRGKTTEYHQGVFERMLTNGQLVAAETYLKANSDEITPSSMTALQGTLSRQRRAAEGASQTAVIKAEASRLEREMRLQGMTYAQMQNAVDAATTNGDMTEAVGREVMVQASAVRTRLRENRRAEDQEFLTRIDETVLGGFEDGSIPLTSRLSDVLATLPAADQEALRQRGLMAKVTKNYRSLRNGRIADMMAKDPEFELLTEMIQNQKDVADIIRLLSEQKADLPKELQGGEREQRIDQQIERLEGFQELLASKLYEPIDALHTRLQPDSPSVVRPSFFDSLIQGAQETARQVKRQSLVEPPKVSPEEQAQRDKWFRDTFSNLKFKLGAGR